VISFSGWRILEMAAGKRFRLDNPAVAIDVRGGKRVTTMVPSGTVVTVLSFPTNELTVEVLCESRTLVMFVLDLRERGTDITEQRTSSQESN
jgi:hypothetical protein